MSISKEKIEEIRATADIVDVISDYVRLKQSGSRYKGLCPFHDEDTPSFSVDPNQKLFYCFGCQKGGDLFSFLQDMEGLSFPEAARMLAERHGITIPESEVERSASSERESIFHALRFAARYFYQQLTQEKKGKEALSYLLEQRGLTATSIKKFGLGYAPDGWSNLLGSAQEASIEEDHLEKAGLIISRKGGKGYYDRYRGRVIFPIFSHVGKVLGFAGRILDQDSDQPKYINSPETRVYHKSQVLYGLHQAKHAIRKNEEALLVEGYTDVISLYQAGIEHVVAASGTALTREQVNMLDRYAQRITLLYDSDEAGSRAALRSINLVLREGMAVYVVALPGGEDPDTYVQEFGAESFEEFIEKNRRDFVEFQVKRARKQGQMDSPEGEAEIMHQVVDSIAQIPDALMRETYLKRASDLLGVPDIKLHEVLRNQGGSPSRPVRSAPHRKAPVPQPVGDEEAPAQGPDPLPPEKVLLRLMLEKGSPMIELVLGNMALDEFSEGPVRKMVEKLLGMYQERDFEANRFLEGDFGQEVQSLAASVMVTEYEPSLNWQQLKNISVDEWGGDAYEAAISAMAILKEARVDEEYERVKKAQFRADPDSDMQRDYQKQLMQLQDLKRRIKKREFLEWN